MPERKDVELARVVMELVDTAHRRISRVMDLPRMQVLAFLAEHGPVRPQSIAAALEMSPPAVSRHLSALEDTGRITTRRDPTDDRTYLVGLADAGAGDLRAGLDAGTSRFRQVIADWSDRDVAEAHRLIEKLLTSWAPTAPAPAGRPRRRRLRDMPSDGAAP